MNMSESENDNNLSMFELSSDQVVKIPVDEGAEAREYMIWIYERIRLLHSPSATTVASEVATSSQTSGASVSMKFSYDTSQNEIPESIEVKEFLDVKTIGDSYLTPIFRTAERLQERMRIVEHHERRIEQLLVKLSRVYHT